MSEKRQMWYGACYMHTDSQTHNPNEYLLDGRQQKNARQGIIYHDKSVRVDINDA